jgi:hypothetical protein
MKPVSVSVRQRQLLHRLLHGDSRQCTASSLMSAKGHGWAHGIAGGFELTERGRRLAEHSEQADPRGMLIWHEPVMPGPGYK